MDSDERFEELKKKITYLNEEGFVPDGRQLHLFRNVDDLVRGIKAGEIPGVEWTEECEAKWQMEKRLEREFGKSSIEEDPWL